VDPGRWPEIFDELMGRIAGRFGRVELRRRGHARRNRHLVEQPRLPRTPTSTPLSPTPHMTATTTGQCSSATTAGYAPRRIFRSSARKLSRPTCTAGLI